MRLDESCANLANRHPLYGIRNSGIVSFATTTILPALWPTFTTIPSRPGLSRTPKTGPGVAQTLGPRGSAPAFLHRSQVRSLARPGLHLRRRRVRSLAFLGARGSAPAFLLCLRVRRLALPVRVRSLAFPVRVRSLAFPGGLLRRERVRSLAFPGRRLNPASPLQRWRVRSLAFPESEMT